MHVSLPHHPQVLDLQVLSELLDVVVHEWVHELHQHLHRRLLDDPRVVRFVHHILQQQHEQDEDLLEAPGFGGERDGLEELGQPEPQGGALKFETDVLAVGVDEVLKFPKGIHLLPYFQVYFLRGLHLPKLHEDLLESVPVNFVFAPLLRALQRIICLTAHLGLLD